MPERNMALRYTLFLIGWNPVTTGWATVGVTSRLVHNWMEPVTTGWVTVGVTSRLVPNWMEPRYYLVGNG
eukprot:142756-Amorphochlora_amoeboformis.AAC.1